MKPKEEFIELLCEINRIKGMDELSSRIIGILYAEPREVSLEELAERTGYSLSAVSTSMKFLAGSEFVKRVKKPGSRKVYFYMEKDMIGSFLKIFGERTRKIILIMKDRVPGIMERYKKESSPRGELNILENYYKQLIVMEKITEKMIGMVERAEMEARKNETHN